MDPLKEYHSKYKNVLFTAPERVCVATGYLNIVSEFGHFNNITIVEKHQIMYF